MEFSFQYPNRFVIPIWRSFDETVKLHELESLGTNVNPTPDFSDLIEDWRADKNIVTASEVLNAGLTTKNFQFEDFESAKDFLIQNVNADNSPLLQILHKVEHDQEIEKQGVFASSGFFSLFMEGIGSDNIGAIWDRVSKKRLNANLHEIKKLSRKHLKNPVIWVDMSLRYSIQGHFKHAERAMTIALSLAPDNRFVLRAATCLFVHLGDGEKALFYLRKSARTKEDPWLISAQIAASSSIGRFSTLIKEGRNIIAGRRALEKDLTELASSLGTEEYNAGAVKKSRKFLEVALKKPNDNTLAQVEWLSQKGKLFNFNPFKYSKIVPQPFEANALESYEKQKWEDALINGVKWFFDCPYNKTSLMFVTYLLTNIFDKYNEAITFCKVGLRIYPDDPGLLNDFVYANIMEGHINEIEGHIKKMSSIDQNSLSDTYKVAVLATLGLVKFREGDFQSGKRLYLEAISLAKKFGLSVSREMAYLNLTREAAVAGIPERYEYIAGLKRIADESHSYSIRYTAKKLLKQLREKSAIAD